MRNFNQNVPGVNPYRKDGRIEKKRTHSHKRTHTYGLPLGVHHD